MSLREVVVIMRLALVVVCAFVMCWSCEMSLHVIFAVGTGGFLGASSAQYCWGLCIAGDREILLQSIVGTAWALGLIRIGKWLAGAGGGGPIRVAALG